VFLLDEAHLLHQDTLDHLHILLNYAWDSRALLRPARQHCSGWFVADHVQRLVGRNRSRDSRGDGQCAAPILRGCSAA
jgi:hypothetical protein